MPFKRRDRLTWSITEHLLSTTRNMMRSKCFLVYSKQTWLHMAFVTRTTISWPGHKCAGSSFRSGVGVPRLSLPHSDLSAEKTANSCSSVTQNGLVLITSAYSSYHFEVVWSMAGLEFHRRYIQLCNGVWI